MIGFLIVLLSSVFFCFQNVIVRVLFNAHAVFGVWQTGGFVSPTVQHSLLLMFMRMVWVVPLMAILAPRLYPPVWQEIGQLRFAHQRSLLLQSAGCGLLMFLYLVLIYLAVGMIPTGIALTLFFTYPAFTALFSWQLFGDRLTLFRWGVMGLTFLGSFLTVPHFNPATDHASLMGIITGVASGVAYALYTVFAQKSFEKLHPVPFTWLSFAITLGLSGISLLAGHWHDAQLPWLPLWIGSLLSALFTFAGHLLNNFGIRQVGATAAAMIGASNPALTVVLAWVAIQETLAGVQLLGVAIATLSVTLLSRERTK